MGERYIFQIESLTKTYNKKEVLKNIWLSFYPGAKIGVIGSNGAGKSTLLKIMAGVDTDFIGTARPESGISIGHVPQEPRLNDAKDVRGNIEEAVASTRALLTRQEELGNRMAEASPEEFDAISEEMARVQDAIDACNAYELDRQLEIAMDAMRLPPSDAMPATLSGGERRRVALCKTLLARPDMLLLDEPTNHLDAESVDWLERFLKEFTGTVVSVTHDRYFLDNVAEWILELDRGNGYPFQGNYTSWLQQKQERLIREEKSESARKKQLDRELEWARMAPRARVAKNKARLAAYEKLAAQEYDEKEENLVLQIPPGPALGDLVVRAEGVQKGYGDRLLMEDLNFDLPRGGIVGVIGPNGAGKTTLFRMIVGQEKPDTGSLRVGETVVPAYVDQNRDALNPDKTVFEEITGGVDHLILGKKRVASRGYVARFNFKGVDQQKRVGDLSGGERNRVHLAKLLRGGGNLLLLDEPTNDLDVDTLRALEEALINFGGCAVVISHDRWFLDRIATHILAFEGDSRTVWHEGNYRSYEENRKARLGLDADQPSRVRFKKLHQ
ncbi:energy-dependent translational throttle protein EttA [Tuwongella immobilis]|uniref:Energy-dependent translational throttle protein EttA n=1 Tax=Tuwongella immobilis TaxID=692036 RepID=A0A6C2YPG4_9BACT|nr:energy-dependent translational throttle protein EttA [Tuwongella immobilis]VIP03023.1 heme abc transporter atp-binding protein : ABC transporter related protein OS=Isosphaera pallida (strain ATCC 43644 / DSM 9630 / IS1B) GN=Isop_2142 PE=3 SV=1: ABC_tran: ABC_tran_2: ABC_tran [Tuwongella immobilis]VTS03157.1 heme abc transporter atp-binding protein : ABC transporter related protein OS=Isosphaera pallida (strain ATCC 43644 / DSM 9630 / IS1B) GN=Isop_2142 PE=3 SV=1: ABC_tran: ABC_tran_2: ABC_tran